MATSVGDTSRDLEPRDPKILLFVRKVVSSFTRLRPAHALHTHPSAHRERAVKFGSSSRSGRVERSNTLTARSRDGHPFHTRGRLGGRRSQGVVPTAARRPRRLAQEGRDEELGLDCQVIPKNQRCVLGSCISSGASSSWYDLLKI